MPHMILEYTDNVEFDTMLFFKELHHTLVETGAINLKGLKSRAIKLTDYLIADGNPKYKMVHLTMIFREGRSDAVKKEIAERSMGLLEKTFGHYRDKGHISLSTNMSELIKGLDLTNHNIPKL